jgi:hypothetical protein
LINFIIAIYCLTIAYNKVDINIDYKLVKIPSKAIDSYIHNIDQSLCSFECPCYNTTNPTAQNFQTCDERAHKSAFKRTSTKYSDFDLNDTKFWELMAILEHKFECTGWTDGRYVDRLNQEKFISKYLFSDINRGIPKKSGCLQFITIKNLSLSASINSVISVIFTLFAVVFMVNILFKVYS